MLISQSTDAFGSFNADSIEGYIGIACALLAAFFAAYSAVYTLRYADLLFFNVTEKKKPDSKQEQDLLFWLTLFAFAIARFIASILNVGVGFIISNFKFKDLISILTSTRMLGGAIAIGTINALGSTLFRYGNIKESQRPDINALFFISPSLGLGLLMLVGIDLPRFDLFMIGAALILVINILIRLNPDEERDLIRFSKNIMPGVKLGFTSFIMSIWFFGTVLYLRDELMPSSWLKYSTDEYWGLIALSATVFALILGFRIARLSTRINKEDETMFSLFRDSQHLIRRQILSPTIAEEFADLDTAKPNELLVKYDIIRKEVALGRTRLERLEKSGGTCNEDIALLLSVEKRLDMITHSKQQGRDIVELLSLTAFAGVTIGLGLLTRPNGLELNVHHASWSGFLSEVFILLFVSTIAFLCINLFDIRRERETPLLVSVKERGYDYQLFFRQKKNLRTHHIAAVVISAAMSATFCFLLYDKWMP